MHWFESIAFGRVAHGAAKNLGDLSLHELKQIVWRPREIRDRCLLRGRVLKAPPLMLTPTCPLSWVVFTDGACEGPDGARTGRIGGALVCPRGDADPGSLLLGEPLASMRRFVGTWITRLVSYSFLKAYGATRVADGMVQDFTRHGMELQTKSWFSRVPSASDIAGAPSRLEDSLMRDRGALKKWQSAGKLSGKS